MREMSVSEQRYQAILAVIADGRAVSEVAQQWKVDRRTVHSWLARSKGEGLVGLTDRSHRPEQWCGGGCGASAARGGPGHAAEEGEAPHRRGLIGHRRFDQESRSAVRCASTTMATHGGDDDEDNDLQTNGWTM